MEQTDTHSCHIFRDRGFWSGRLLLFDTIRSTNSWAFDHRHNLSHGDTVLAKMQTGGQGRLGSTWFSLPDKSLCFSVCIKNSSLAFPPFLLTQAAAVALAGTLETLGMNPRCKWPNDIYVAHKKLCGILARSDNSSSATILGIGVNNSMSEQDISNAGLGSTATSIRIETGAAPPVMDLFESIRKSLEAVILRINEQGTGILAQSWKELDYFTSEHLRLTVAGRSCTGMYKGIDQRGRLLLEMPDGTVKPFWAGNASKVRPE